MGDEGNEQVENLEDTERTENAIQKEISKLEYYLDGADELLRSNEVEEITVTVKQSSKIAGRLSELIAQLEEAKIDSGETPRAERLWKKDVKAKYSGLLQHKELTS